MPKYFLYLIYTAVFSFILLALVPKKQIRQLSFYGIIFGGLMDVIMLTLGKITGLFGWINYGPLGFIGYPIFASISWAIYFILYYYFLPEDKILIFIYTGVGVMFSVLYTNVVINLDIFFSKSRILLPLLSFIFWFTFATWGYLRLKRYVQAKHKMRIIFKRASTKNKL